MLYFQDAFSAEIFGLCMRVAPNHITAFVALEIPWGNNYDVTFADPNASFHFAADSAESFFAVLAFN